MRSGIIITRANYPIGSWSNRVRMIAKGLLYHDIYIEVFVTAPWPTQENINNSEEFITYLTKPCEKKESVFSVFKQLQTLYQLYKKLIKRKDIDFIFLTDDRFLESIIVSRICKVKNMKLFVDIVDENGRKFDSSKKGMYAYLAMLNREMFNKTLSNYSKIFVISTYLKSKYKNILDGDIENKVILSPPTFIDEDMFNKNILEYDIREEYNLNIEKDDVIICYAGSCLRPNGILFFLDVVYEIIFETKFKIKIVLVFHIGDVERIRTYVSNKLLVNNVIILENISPKLIPSLYNRSDILLLPEQGDVIANAGFPGKTGEYLISGKAIISTNFSDLNLYLKNKYNCMISEIGDYKVYKDNLHELISDSELRRNIGENAKKTGMEYFDYKNAVKIYVNEINS